MNTVSRGVRNAFRNIIRTFSIVVILGLSIGLALAMLVARASVEKKIEDVKTSVGTTITIMPAGAQGFLGGGEPLKSSKLQEIASLPNVKSVSQTLSDRFTEETSNLKSAIEPGTLGNRGAASSGVSFSAGPMMGGVSAQADPNGGEPIVRVFTPPVLVTGLTDISQASAYGGDTITYTSGQAIDPTKDEDKAVIGKALAEKNSLTVGSTFTAYGKTITVVGIYDTGNVFSNGNLIMPLKALQRLSDQADSVTSATVTINSVDNMESAVAAVESTLGSTADVTSNLASAKDAIKPLESVKTISTYSLLGAVGAGAVIILLTMLMIVRERRREIGVFKAIGASNVKVMLQFVSEAVTLTILALIAGLIIGSMAAAPVTRVLVNNSTSESSASAPQTDTFTVSTQSAPPPPPGGGTATFSARGGAIAVRSFGNETITNAKNVQASVGTEILLYGLATAFVIAILGSALPTFLIAKIRPAEIMRAE